jgi:small subunit ribosomal protein S13
MLRSRNLHGFAVKRQNGKLLLPRKNEARKYTILLNQRYWGNTTVLITDFADAGPSGPGYALLSKNFFHMIYLLNNNFEESQKVRLALQKIYGINIFLSNQICDQLGFSQQIRVQNLTALQIDQLVRVVNQYYFTSSELKRIIQSDIKRLSQIGSYRGFRHTLSLPVRGQRTKTNSRSVRNQKKGNP